MNKHIITILLLSITFSTALGNGSECKKFREGTYKIIYNEEKTFHIERQGNIQSEVIVGDTDTSFYIVEWISDCTYTLTPTERTLKEHPIEGEDPLITVEITAVRDNSYMQTTTANFTDFVFSGEVIKTD